MIAVDQEGSVTKRSLCFSSASSAAHILSAVDDMDLMIASVRGSVGSS